MNNNLPSLYKAVDLTHRDSNRDIKTSRAFLSGMDDKFVVPDEWRTFNGVLAPHGVGSTSIAISDMIKWEYV